MIEFDDREKLMAATYIMVFKTPLNLIGQYDQPEDMNEEGRKQMIDAGLNMIANIVFGQKTEESIREYRKFICEVDAFIQRITRISVDNCVDFQLNSILRKDENPPSQFEKL